jgi:UDP-N-acetylmuramate--alanine ligase
VAVFQPHLPSRTQDFLTQFAEALVYGGADSVYLTEIYLAREQPRPGLIELLAEKVPGATLVSDRSALPARLHSELRAGDVAIFMGAGNIREQAEEFLTLGS